MKSQGFENKTQNIYFGGILWGRNTICTH